VHCATVSCRVLQCAAVCCSVLHTPGTQETGSRHAFVQHSSVTPRVPPSTPPLCPPSVPAASGIFAATVVLLYFIVSGYTHRYFCLCMCAKEISMCADTHKYRMCVHKWAYTHIYTGTDTHRHTGKHRHTDTHRQTYVYVFIYAYIYLSFSPRLCLLLLSLSLSVSLLCPLSLSLSRCLSIYLLTYELFAYTYIEHMYICTRNICIHIYVHVFEYVFASVCIFFFACLCKYYIYIRVCIQGVCIRLLSMLQFQRTVMGQDWWAVRHFKGYAELFSDTRWRNLPFSTPFNSKRRNDGSKFKY